MKGGSRLWTERVISSEISNFDERFEQSLRPQLFISIYWTR